MSFIVVPRCGTMMVLHERTKPPYLLTRGTQASNQPSAVLVKYNSAAVPQKRDCDMSFYDSRLWLQIDVLHWPTKLIPCINIQ